MNRRRTRPFRLAWSFILVVIVSIPGHVARATQGQSGVTRGQQPAKPLTNDDIISMVKNGLPEDVIVHAIQANDTNFDISAAGLIALKKEGISPKLIDAMLAAAASKKSPPSAAPTGGTPPAVPPAGDSSQGVLSLMSAMKAALGGGVPGTGTTNSSSGFDSSTPTVAVLDEGAPRALAYERTFVAHTKSTSSSLTEVAKDSAMRGALDAGLNQAVSSTQAHLGSSIGGSVAGSVIGDTSSSVIAGILAKREGSETLVWAVSGTTSSNVVSSGSPVMEVTYASLAGINPTEFEPAIVKLSPAQGSYRLVGATRHNTDFNQIATSDWEVYSSFMEDRVPTRVKQLGPGHAQISPASTLAAGEYAVVLRPLSKDKRFSGVDVLENRGDGLLFNAAWSFAVR